MNNQLKRVEKLEEAHKQREPEDVAINLELFTESEQEQINEALGIYGEMGVQGLTDDQKRLILRAIDRSREA